MKTQINSVPALIYWFSKALRVLNVLKTDDSSEKSGISMTDDPREFLKRFDSVVRDPGNVEVQGELLRPVLDFKEKIETMLYSLKNGDRHSDDKQRIRQNKHRLRDESLDNLLLNSRFFYDSLKFHHDTHKNPEAELIIEKLVRPRANMSPDELLVHVEELIEAEQLLIRMDYPVVTNPSAETLSELIVVTNKALGEAQAASTDLVQARRYRVHTRDEGRRLVRRIARYLDYFYNEMPDEQKRVIERELGYFFETKRRDEEEPDTEDEEEIIDDVSEPDDSGNEEVPEPAVSVTTTATATADTSQAASSQAPRSDVSDDLDDPDPTLVDSDEEVPPMVL